jgi:hypothetical protein
MIRIKMFDNLPPASSLTRIITIVFSILFLYIGVREVIAPTGMDVGFGIPLSSTDGITYLSVVGARNIALSLLWIFAVLTGSRAGMSAIYAVISLMAALDFFIVSSTVGLTDASIKHAIFVLIMASMSIWVANSKGEKKN